MTVDEKALAGADALARRVFIAANVLESNPTALRMSEARGSLIGDLRETAKNLSSFAYELSKHASDFDEWWAARDKSLAEHRALAKEAWQRGASHAEALAYEAAKPAPSPAEVSEGVRANEHGIMPCKCGSYPTLSGDGARPDDGYRTLWCQSCQKHVTEWHSSEQAAIRTWNEERELDTGATSHYSATQPEEAALTASPAPAEAWTVRLSADEDEREEARNMDSDAYEVLTPDGRWESAIAVDAADARDCIKKAWDWEQAEAAKLLPPAGYASPVAPKTSEAREDIAKALKSAEAALAHAAKYLSVERHPHDPPDFTPVLQAQIDIKRVLTILQSKTS